MGVGGGMGPEGLLVTQGGGGGPKLGRNVLIVLVVAVLAAVLATIGVVLKRGQESDELSDTVFLTDFGRPVRSALRGQWWGSVGGQQAHLLAIVRLRLDEGTIVGDLEIPSHPCFASLVLVSVENETTVEFDPDPDEYSICESFVDYRLTLVDKDRIQVELVQDDETRFPYGYLTRLSTAVDPPESSPSDTPRSSRSPRACPSPRTWSSGDC